MLVEQWTRPDCDCVCVSHNTLHLLLETTALLQPAAHATVICYGYFSVSVQLAIHSVSVFTIFFISVIVNRIKFYPLKKMNPFPLPLTKHCSYGLHNSRYNANEWHHPSSLAENWKFCDVRLHIYCICVGMRPSMPCTQRLVEQCRRQLDNENWNNIYSVSVVKLSVSVLVFWFFPFSSIR